MFRQRREYLLYNGYGSHRGGLPAKMPHGAGGLQIVRPAGIDCAVAVIRLSPVSLGRSHSVFLRSPGPGIFPVRVKRFQGRFLADRPAPVACTRPVRIRRAVPSDDAASPEEEAVCRNRSGRSAESGPCLARLREKTVSAAQKGDACREFFVSSTAPTIPGFFGDCQTKQMIRR